MHWEIRRWETQRQVVRECKLSGAIYSPSGIKVEGDIPEFAIVMPILNLRWDLGKASALLWEDSC